MALFFFFWQGRLWRTCQLLSGTETTLPFLGGSICSSFSVEICAILQALCWSRQHQQVCHFFLFSSYLNLALSSPLFFLLLQSLWQIWQKLFSLFSCIIRLQWVPGYSFLPGNDATDELARQRALLVPSAILCSLSSLISRIHSWPLPDWRCTISSKFFDTQISLFSTEELVLPRQARCVLSRLRSNGHSLLLSSHFFRIGRIENRESFLQRLRTPSQDSSHLILHCPATEFLRHSLSGDSLSLYDFCSRLWVVSRLLRLHGLRPCPHPSEAVR